MSSEIDFFVALERRVRQSLTDSDISADSRLLDPEFVGVYAAGFGSKDDHLAQLRTGPIVESFAIEDPRLLVFAPDTVLLAYRATFTPAGKSDSQVVHTMYVSSVWKQRGADWINIFSQDTMADQAATRPGVTLRSLRHAPQAPRIFSRNTESRRFLTLLIFTKGDAAMGDSGKKDKGKRETQKKAQLDPKAKRKLKQEKKHKSSSISSR